MVESGQLQQELEAQWPAGRPPLQTLGFDECAGEQTHRALSSSRAWVWPIIVLRVGWKVPVDKTRLDAAAPRFGLPVPPGPLPEPQLVLGRRLSPWPDLNLKLCTRASRRPRGPRLGAAL